MTERVYRVLFLSRRNSARSVMAEAILNKIGKGRFEAFSAAVEPAAAIDPMVADLLKSAEYPFEQQKPRHYSEFAGEGAQNLDFVFTLSRHRRRRAAAAMAGHAGLGALEQPRSGPYRGPGLGEGTGPQPHHGRAGTPARHLRQPALRRARSHEPAAQRRRYRALIGAQRAASEKSCPSRLFSTTGPPLFSPRSMVTDCTTSR